MLYPYLINIYINNFEMNHFINYIAYMLHIVCLCVFKFIIIICKRCFLKTNSSSIHGKNLYRNSLKKYIHTQNIHYYAHPAPGNIWNNPNRISAKQAIYYHQPNILYDGTHTHLETNLKDHEKQNMADNQKIQDKRLFYTHYKQKDAERLRQRKTERQMVSSIFSYNYTVPS